MIMNVGGGLIMDANGPPRIPGRWLEFRNAGVIAICLATTTMAAAVETTGKPTSKLIEVTVFPDRAELVRELTVELPAGPSVVEFPGLPKNIETNSLRVEGVGVEATIGAVELQRVVHPPKEDPEYSAAEAALLPLERKLAELDAAESTAKELHEFLLALKAATAPRQAEKSSAGVPDPTALRGVYELLRTGLEELARASLERKVSRQELGRKLEVARARLAAARPAGSIETRTATVEIAPRRAGELKLQLTYVTPGASWQPSYRASLDPGTGNIQLASEAVIRQQTGEDWTNVQLRLSTASPVRGVEPPELPLVILKDESLPSASGSFSRIVRTSEKDLTIRERDYQDILTLASGVVAPRQDKPQTETERQQAALARSAYNVSFVVPGLSDVPADGREYRVGIREEEVRSELEYVAVPAQMSGAFLVAQTKCPADYPLLAGPVRVLVGSAYIGTFRLDEVGPRADLTLPFGVDNRIPLERTPLPREQQRSGVFGKERIVAYGFRTTVHNLRDESVKIVVRERLPVSGDDRIEVEIGKATSQGWEEIEDRLGFIVWNLELEPMEKKELVLEYRVRFPRDLEISQLP